MATTHTEEVVLAAEFVRVFDPTYVPTSNEEIMGALKEVPKQSVLVDGMPIDEGIVSVAETHDGNLGYTDKDDVLHFVGANLWRHRG